MNAIFGRASLPIVLGMLCLSAYAADDPAVTPGPAAQAPASSPKPVESAPAPVQTETPIAADAPAPATAGPTVEAVAPGGSDDLRLNFSDAPLDKVLDYLSEAAGFIVIKEAKVDSTVNVVSHKSLNKQEAVDLLNTVLSEKGFAAIRNGRTLTIMKREDAKKRDIPVKSSGDPETIPKNAEMVTQIIPVRHADAAQLLENLTPLLASDAVANANKSSNAIVLTDTQVNVHRMAEIIKALDTSISAISEVKVFQLTYSKASDTAKLVNTLFQAPAGQPNANAAVAQLFQRMRGGGPGAAAAQAQPDSAARQAATRVQAVADDRTNSVIVSAPNELMPLIDDVILQIDRVGAPATEIRVFPLKFANSDEMAQVINDAFTQTTTAGAGAAQSGGRFFERFGGGSPSQDVQRVTDTTVRAVSDYRTNSVIVTAESGLMDQIVVMVERLDSNPAREQKVFVYKVENADVADVASLMQGMFSQQGTTTPRPAQSSTRATTTPRNTTSSNLGSRRSASTLGR
ncbi:MAG: hypothetical protein HZB26_01005 [Candidatus Hydrogenedentes bacterium]|nr:hypothetical protein [Candidatus Hydrogenedentota bacterium]